MHSSISVAVLAAALVIVSGAAQAQRQVEHRGFWISPGLGFAATFSDPYYDQMDNAALGAALLIRLGGTLSQHVLLGADLSAWIAGDGLMRGHTAMSVLYYPGDNGGLFARALAGFAQRTVQTTLVAEVDGELHFLDLEETSSGLGLGAGIGYDVPLARNFFLTPGVDGIVQYQADHWAPSIIVSLSATWH